MRADYSSISKAVRTLQRLRPTVEELDHFKACLGHFISEVDKVRKASTSGALEEVEKGLIQDFLKDAFYRHHAVQNLNYQGQVGADLTIRSSQNNTLVLFEVKSGTNAEMVTREELLTKAFLECVVYYGFEKDQRKNDHIKHVVITNSREWFVFDAVEFRAATWDKPAVHDAFRQWRKGNLDSTSTSHLYARLKEVLSGMDTVLPGTNCDLWSYRKYLTRTDEEATKELMKLWRFFHPAHLLKEGVGNDSNALNKNFYHELLYILGLREVKDKGRKLIQRSPASERQPGALVEHTMARLDKDGALDNVKDLEGYGATKEEQLFNVAMELCITWLNRVLFLKLLEAQLLRFHNGDRRYAFLSPDTLKDFDQFHALFFDVMAVERDKRDAEVKEQYAHIPYLNSSLFEPTPLEKQAMQISGLKNNLTLKLYPRTVLVEDGLRGMEPTAQEYLLRFLQAYDFGSEPGEGPKANNRPLITASVLGLIFEKINGYQDGSFYTPGYITMYMCRETIRRAVLQRFNEGREQPLGSWAALVNYTQAQFEPDVIAAAEAKVDGLRICDPAVGSGHFLVSALNELIAIKSELGVLTDAEGRRIADWRVEVVNDELVVTNRNSGDAFQYAAPPDGKPIATDKQRVQSALFEQKRKLIENGLFGVDINANSVKICRLRLWIELLKNAYYTEAGGTRELRTLPNIDINIKHGNSVLQRYKLTDNIDTVLGRTRYTVEQYQGFVADYQEATDRDQRRAFHQLIEQIEQGFTKNVLDKDPRKLELGRLATRYQELTGGLFGGGYSTDKAKAKAEAERQKLEQRMGKLQEALEAEKAGLNHKLAFDWRYRFPQVLDAKTGAYRGFDVILANPPYLPLEDLTPNERSNLRAKFPYFRRKFDTSVPFLLLGLELLRKDGSLAYIIPQTWQTGENYDSFRRHLFQNYGLVQVINLPFDVFEDPFVDTGIVVMRAKPVSQFELCQYDKKEVLTELNTPAFQLVEMKDVIGPEYKIPLDDFTSSIIHRAWANGRFEMLGVLTKSTQGLARSSFPPSSDDEGAMLFPFLAKAKSQKYTVDKVEVYQTDMRNHGKLIEYYDAIPRVLVRRIIGRDDRLSVAYCDERLVTSKDTNPFIPTDVRISGKYLVGIMASRLFSYLYTHSSAIAQKDDFRQTTLGELRKLPIPLPSEHDKLHLEDLVTRRMAGDGSAEAEIDRVVYGLYGLNEEEVKVVEGS